MCHDAKHAQHSYTHEHEHVQTQGSIAQSPRYEILKSTFNQTGHFHLHPAAIVSVYQLEGWWKGMPAKSDVRAVLVKILQKGIRWVFLTNVIKMSANEFVDLQFCFKKACWL